MVAVATTVAKAMEVAGKVIRCNGGGGSGEVGSGGGGSGSGSGKVGGRVCGGGGGGDTARHIPGV